MTTPELITFVKGEMAKGVSKDSIISMLKPQGWTDLDITETFNEINPVVKSVTSPVAVPDNTATPVHVMPTMNNLGGVSMSNMQSASKVSIGSKLKFIVGTIVLVIVVLFAAAGVAWKYIPELNNPYLTKIYSKYIPTKRMPAIENPLTKPNTNSSLPPVVISENPPLTPTAPVVNTTNPATVSNLPPVTTHPVTNPSTTAVENPKDSAIASTEMSIKAQAQVYYNKHNSYQNFCSGKVSDGAFTYAKQLPNNSIYKCNESTVAWASYVKTSYGYFCADFSGFSGAVTGHIPSGTSCGGK